MLAQTLFGLHNRWGKFPVRFLLLLLVFVLVVVAAAAAVVCRGFTP